MYHIYILRCSDDSFYVGYTRDIGKRLETHNRGDGASHTAKRLPIRLIYSEHHATRIAAVRRERQIKGWTRKKKQALVNGDYDTLKILSRRRK